MTSAAPRLRLGCWRQAGGGSGSGTQRPLVDAAVQLRCAGTLAMALRGAIGDTGSPAEPLQSRRAGRRGNRARRAVGLLQSMPAGNGRCRSVDRACSLGGTAGQQATPRAKLRAQCPCEPIACFNTLVDTTPCFWQRLPLIGRSEWKPRTALRYLQSSQSADRPQTRCAPSGQPDAPQPSRQRGPGSGGTGGERRRRGCRRRQRRPSRAWKNRP